jgi:hypothetical protein
VDNRNTKFYVGNRKIAGFQGNMQSVRSSFCTVGWREGKALESEEGKVLGSEEGKALGSEEGKVLGSEEGKALGSEDTQRQYRSC